MSSVPPGWSTTADDARPSPGPSTTYSTPLVIGEVAKGPDTPTRVTSLRDKVAKLGDRTPETANVHDWLEAWFALGGGPAYVAPVRGAAAAPASLVLKDALNATAATVTATAKGLDGTRYSVQVLAGSATGLFKLVILRDATPVRTSGDLVDNVAAQAWVAQYKPAGGTNGASGDPGPYLTYTPDVGGDPAPLSPAALIGGSDDFPGVPATQVAAAGARYLPKHGTGVYVLPGRTSLATQMPVADLLLQAKTNRIFRPELPDLADPTLLAQQGATYRAHGAAGRIDPIAQRSFMPGLSSSTVRTVSQTVLRCAREAVNERAGLSPNQGAAGDFGRDTSGYLSGLTREFTDDQRVILNNAGINASIVDDEGFVALYGIRTAADPAIDPAGLYIGSARLLMAGLNLVGYELARTNFAEFDPEGLAQSNLESRCRLLKARFPRSLYRWEVTSQLIAGEDPGSFVVEVPIVMQASPNAEVLRGVVTRQVTEVTA